jgi:hypothetical protein
LPIFRFLGDREMKKVFSFFLSLLMIFQLAVPLTASAGDNPSVYISTNRITPGETVKMPVVINGAANTALPVRVNMTAQKV